MNPRREIVLARRVFWASVVITALLYAVPYGQYLAYPLLLLSTLVHELGHGFTAVLVGGSFHEFKMWADGSGVASHSGQYSAMASAMVSAGGLIGPALGAGVGLFCARRDTVSRWFLFFVGAVLVASEILVVRNLFAVIFVGVVAATCLGTALRLKGAAAQSVVVFLSVQLALAVFSRGDYLFTRYAETAAGTMPSDVERMAEALGGPYWLWGAICAAVSAAALAAGARWLFRKQGG